jgi:hypothetical protein
MGYLWLLLAGPVMIAFGVQSLDIGRRERSRLWRWQWRWSGGGGVIGGLILTLVGLVGFIAHIV